MSALKQQSAHLRKRRRAPATLKAYEQDWEHFRDWCAGVGRQALPASEETLELYLTHFSAVHKLSNLQHRVSGISQAHQAAGHPSPIGPGVRAILEAWREPEAPGRCRKPRSRRTAARHLPAAGSANSDRALLVLGFATGLRRSELAALQLDDVEFVEQGIIVEVCKSKTDQRAQGRAIGIFPDRERKPVRFAL